jgi:site-specific DNA-methyltransferase (adenine-specific)
MTAPGILYESDLATVVLGDATDPDIIAAAPTADLLCTDPPYGVKWQSGSRTTAWPQLAGDDGTLDVPAVLGAWVRRGRRNRHVYVFGYRPDQLTEPLKLGGTAELIWDKRMFGLGRLDTPWGTAHEPLTFGMYSPHPSGRARGNGRLSARLRRGTVLSVPRKNAYQVRRHPTEKPVALMRQLIESSTVLDERVCDPFAGVGSTGVAAILAGRRAYLVEIDEHYASVAVDRIQAAERIARDIAAA